MADLTPDRPPSNESGGWWLRLHDQTRDGVRDQWSQFRRARPSKHLRLGFTLVLLLCGALLLGELVVPQYDRALSLSGRTEVLSVRLDNPDFGDLAFGSATYRPDPDTRAQEGAIELKIARGTRMVFKRGSYWVPGW